MPFEQVPDLVGSRRVFLKKGYAYLEMGQREQGLVQLQQVIRGFPETDEANLARQRLASLGVDSG